MAEINYTVLQSTLDGVGYENYSSQDRSVVDSFEINTAYDESKHNIELHIYGLDGTLLDSNLSYRGAQQLQGSDNGNNLSIDPERDALQAGYDQGDVKLLYSFLNNISPEEFFIQEVSADRTELRVLPLNPTFDASNLVSEIQSGISTGAYFNEFRLNFGGNDLLIGLNIDIKNSVLVKLYEPLPPEYAVKSRFSFDEIVSDSVVFEIQAEFIPDAPVYPTLRGANFNIESGEEKVQPTEYFDYDSLYSFDVTSSLHGVITQLSSSGVELSIDYTDYENFIHFSSAEERVRNFHYKMGLLEQYDYSASISTTYQPQYDNLTKGIISKFDDYEKYLYFKSGSKAWPKSNTNIPYINDTVSNSTSWFNEQVASASLHDELNESRLTYTVPEFIREDSSNAPYNLFLDMIGQHFDNLWIYSKAMTDKYDADNRLNVGVSKDLIRDVLKSFGVKLYTSNFSVSNLAASFIGEFYQSGSEQINTFVTASNDPTPDKDILSETYKRIYHNLPYLIKTKGTERGLRALINCFGIPSGSLEITEVGGYTKDSYFFNRSETVDKIRLDNTGSIVSGDTLSQYSSIQNIDDKYTQDSHQVDISFSPSKYLNTHIENQITGSYPSGFNLDEYIGDPALLSSNSYTALNQVAETALSGSDRYDVFDFVRLVKFFDNQLFKMVKDFVPARAVTTTGITVKPHILNRSKVAVPTPIWNRPEYSGSIDTAFTEGSEGGVILSTVSTAYTASFSTLSGSVNKIIDNNIPQFNGELGGSTLTVTTQSLNPGNPLVNIYQPTLNYAVNYYDLGNFSESNQFTGSLAEGEIKVGYFEFPRGEGFEYIPYYLRVHNASLDSTGILDPLRNADTLVVHGYVYKPVTTVVDTYGSDGVYMTLPTGGSSLPSTNNQASKVLRLKPYIDVNITYHEYNAILNNATDIRRSNVFKQSDRYSGVEPNNITAILSTSASRAEIQDSNYSSKAYTNSRYDGSKHTATVLHTQSLDTGLVPVSNPQTYFSYFNWLGGTSPNWGNNLNDRVAANIKYVISLDGETITPSNDAEGLNLSLIEQNFKTGEQATISLDSDSNAKFYSLNGTWDIFKSGKRIEPIIYSQTQSVQDNEVTGYGVADRLTFFSSNVPNSSVTSDMKFSATLEGGVEIKDSTVPFTIGLIEEFSGADASLVTLSGNDIAQLNPDSTDQNQLFSLTIIAVVNVNRTSLYRNTITFEIQKQIDSGPWLAIEQGVLDLQKRETSRTVEVEDTITDTTGTKLFKYRLRVTEVDKSSSAFAAEIDPYGTYLKITHTPTSANFANTSSAYWSVDSTDRTYVSASTGNTGLSTFYNEKQNDIEESGFTEIRYPFTVREGDEIRFEATENFAYRINEVVTEQPQLILKLDGEVPEGINTNMFLIRRYVDDPSSIILDVDKPAGGTSGGILKPEFLPSGSERQLQKVVQTLRRQNQI